MSAWNSQNNRAVWFDIPVADLERASTFYGAVLGLAVHPQEFGPTRFAVIDHGDGNGGCLVVDDSAITSTGGILVYLNAEGRIRDAEAQVIAHGGRVIEPIHPIGPHGFRAIVVDSEGNRVALHSSVDA